MRKKFPNISAMLITTAVVILISGVCSMGVFYDFRPSALAVAETNGLLGICAAVAIMAACRFIVQAGLALLCILWLSYFGWLVVSRKRKVD